jgi:hypothetical protein
MTDLSTWGKHAEHAEQGSAEKDFRLTCGNHKVKSFFSVFVNTFVNNRLLTVNSLERLNNMDVFNKKVGGGCLVFSPLLSLKSVDRPIKPAWL